MNSYYLALFLYLAEHSYFVLMSDGLQNKTTRWAHAAVRKPLNTSIVAVTFDTISVIGCARACAWSTKIEEVLSFYFEQDLGRCHCNNALDFTKTDPDEPEVTYGILKKRYEDCQAYYKDGFKDGYYQIQQSSGPPQWVFCDMDDGAGWTSIQIRLGDSNGLMFNRSLADYVDGFVDVTRSGRAVWTGLELQHQLTKRGSELVIRIGSLSRGRDIVHSFCSHFTVGDAASNYTMHVSCRPWKFRNRMSSHNGMPFSAPNGDNECADACAGGWWYRHDGTCGQAILNRMTPDVLQCPLWAMSNYYFPNQDLYVMMVVKPY